MNKHSRCTGVCQRLAYLTYKIDLAELQGTYIDSQIQVLLAWIP